MKTNGDDKDNNSDGMMGDDQKTDGAGMGGQ